MRLSMLAPLTLFLGLALATPALAADVYVVHAIPGVDLGLDPALAVDIEVDDAPLLSGVEFGDSAGPVEVTTGEHTVTVRLDNGAGTGAIVATARLQLALLETAVIVANRDSNGTIQLTKFTVDTTPLEDGDARVTLAHAARLAPVDVLVKGVKGTKGTARIRALPNGGSSLPLEVTEGSFRFTVKAQGVKGLVAKLDDVAIAGNVVIVAAGSLQADSFTVIPVVIADDD